MIELREILNLISIPIISGLFMVVVARTNSGSNMMTIYINRLKLVEDKIDTLKHENEEMRSIVRISTNLINDLIEWFEGGKIGKKPTLHNKLKDHIDTTFWEGDDT